jgi:uncharacterized protein DUF1275
VPETEAAYIIIALLAVAMGMRNANVRRLGVPDLTTTVLTMTLTGLAADSQLGGGSGQGSIRRATSGLSLLAGGFTGAPPGEDQRRHPARGRRRAGACRLASVRARRDSVGVGHRR